MILFPNNIFRTNKQTNQRICYTYSELFNVHPNFGANTKYIIIQLFYDIIVGDNYKITKGFCKTDTFLENFIPGLHRIISFFAQKPVSKLKNIKKSLFLSCNTKRDKFFLWGWTQWDFNSKSLLCFCNPSNNWVIVGCKREKMTK